MKTNISIKRSIFLIIFIGMIGGIGISKAEAATYGQQVVAAVIMGEAEGEGELGMLAVAEVIRTRADRRKLSPLAIVKQRKQFSCLNKVSPQQLIRMHWRKKEWKQALRISRLMYNEPEKLPGITKGSTHYANFVPYWAKGKKPVVKIGKHYFWNLHPSSAE